MKNTKRILFLLIIVAAAALIGIPAYRKVRDERKVQEEIAGMQELLKQYESLIPAKLAERCNAAGFEIEGDYTVVPHVELKDNSDYALNNDKYFLCYYPTVSCDITLNERAGIFDYDSDRAKYNTLNSLYKTVCDEYGQLLEECFPQFLSGRDIIITKKVRASYQDEGCTVYIQTAEHLYQHAKRVKDYYVLDDKDHFLRDEASKWYIEPEESKNGTGSYSRPATVRKSGKSGSRKGKDGYSNADDYADDYAEEYMEDGLDYEDAFDEAYDD